MGPKVSTRDPYWPEKSGHKDKGESHLRADTEL